MVLTAPILLILLALGVVQLAAGVVLGRMLPPWGSGRGRAEDPAREASGEICRSEVTALVEQRLARLVQLTGELQGRLQAVEERLALPIAPGPAEDAPEMPSDPHRLSYSLQARLEELSAFPQAR